MKTTLLKLTAAWPLVIFLLLPVLTRGETAVQAWVQRYSGPGNSTDQARAIAVDGSNNVIVTGYSDNSGVWPPISDCVTIKYSSAGVPLWTNLYSAGSANAVAVDGSNNVIVAGSSGGDYVTIRYSSAGVPLWTNRYNGPANSSDSASAVAVDRIGNVFVTGWSFGSGGNQDFATVKYVCVPSPVMTNLSVANGTFQMRVDQVLQPGTLVIEASTNLAGWSPVFTNTTPTNVLFYTDPEAGSHLWRFYRAWQQP